MRRMKSIMRHTPIKPYNTIENIFCEKREREGGEGWGGGISILGSRTATRSIVPSLATILRNSVAHDLRRIILLC